MPQSNTSNCTVALGDKSSGGSKEGEPNASSERWPRMQSVNMLNSPEASAHGHSTASVTTVHAVTNRAGDVADQQGHPTSMAIFFPQ